MEKIDRLRWEAGIAVEAFGVKLGVRVNTSDALELLPNYLPPQWQETVSTEVDHLCSMIMGGTSTRKGMRRYHILYNGPTRISRTMDTEEMLLELASALDFQVALRSPNWVFVHAGVVAINGQAMLIPGRSRSGKSTLVKALVEAGATYYSDEYAVIDADGFVHPYPRPLKIRFDEADKDVMIPINQIGHESGHPPLSVGWIVDTTYVRDKTTWRPKRITTPQACLALLNNTLIARIDPHRALPILHQVATQARGLRGKRGDASYTADKVLQMIDMRRR